jgi:hypothetical protein
VSTPTFWSVVLVLQFSPSVSLEIEGVQVVEGGTEEVVATMTTEKVDLVVVKAGGGVGSWGGSSNRRLLVLSFVAIGSDSLPTHLLHDELPGIVESGTWGVMATEVPNLLNLLFFDD